MALPLRLMSALLSVMLVLTPTLSLAQGGSTNSGLDYGCGLYSEARFQEAISVLEGLLIRGQLTSGQQLEARICLARSYAKAGQESAAKDVFKTILGVDPSWEPDPLVIPPDEISIFRSARAELGLDQEPATGAEAPAETMTDTTATESVPEPAVEETQPKPTVQMGGIADEDGGSKKIWVILGIVAVGSLIGLGLAATE